MKLSLDSLTNNDYKELPLKLPRFDISEIKANTSKAPTWIHFGAGNIFRGFIGRAHQNLLNEGLANSGIIAAESFDYEILDKIYKPFDNLTLMTDLNPDGTVSYELIGSIVDTIKASPDFPDDFLKLMSIASAPTLELLSFTITEKGYNTTDISGKLLPVITGDINNGPSSPRHIMSIITAMLFNRFNAGALPLAVLSLDNCSQNGSKLKSSILFIANKWLEAGFVSEDFITYLNDTSKISFPWSMIDKITPRPDLSVMKLLEKDLHITSLSPITTTKGTYIAPFVNAEVPEYLVIEDSFPGGRPLFEKSGIYMTDRETVDKCERMKVTTCLNPLHTSLAVFGCLLGYDRISEEMKNEKLVSLITRMGYEEGLKVVDDPKILSPEAFINEVITQRLTNPYMPDAPQRIATDTSLKMPIRFGQTLKAYANSEVLDVSSLTFIPLTIAGWIRYLMGIDDKGEDMELSQDPMLKDLQKAISLVEFGNPNSVKDNLDELLSNKTIFEVDLIECGLKNKIESMVMSMIVGPGAVIRTLNEYV